MTTILIKKKDTAGVPAPGDLTNAAGGTEIAVNTATKRIYTKDSGGNVVELGTNPSAITGNLLFNPDNSLDIGASGSSRPRSLFLGTNITVGSLTSTRVPYASTGGLLVDSANMTFDGTTLTAAGLAGPFNGTVGATTPATGAFTTLTTSSTVTLNGGTANGVAYLNGSKVLTTGSALTYTAGLLTVNNSTAKSTVAIGDTASGTYSQVLMYGGAGKYNWSLGAQFNVSDAFEITPSTATGGTTFSTPVYFVNNGGTHVWSSSGSEAMRLTSTGLGIGTSSPSAKLDVQGGNIAVGTTTAGNSTASMVFGKVAAGGGTINNRITLATYGGLYGAYMEAYADLSASTATYLAFGTTAGGGGSPTEKMRLDSSGNLGLGVTPSAASGTRARIEFEFGSTVGLASGGDFNTTSNAYNSATGVWRYKTTGLGASRYSLDFGQYAWFTAPSGTAGNAITFTQAMTLDASGNLLVGTTTNKVAQFGSSATGMTIGAAAYPVLSLWDTGDASWNFCLAQESGTAYLHNVANGPMVFSTNATERARIDSSGNLLVGTTTADAKLTVSGNAIVRDYTGANYLLAALSPLGADRQVFQAGVLGISNGLTVRYVSGAMEYSLTGLGTGTVTSTSGVLSAASDQNMKVADGEIENAIDKVLSLKPRYFFWKDKDGNPDTAKRRQLGFYAQEVNLVVPEASPAPIVESDGWGVYDRSLVATLVKAMQEQQALITSLTARVAALESN